VNGVPATAIALESTISGGSNGSSTLASVTRSLASPAGPPAAAS